MRRVKILILSIFILLGMIGCGQQEQEKDFWAATIQVLESHLENNTYNKGTWQIQVQDKSQVEDESHRSLIIRQIQENENVTKTTTWSLQNDDGKKSISYIYVKSEKENEDRYDYTVDIQSTDTAYQKYEINYQYDRYQSQNHKDGQETTGQLTIDSHQNIKYDNVPLLKESLDACLVLINDFQQQFGINYQDYDFVHLPQLTKDLDIPEIKEISQELSTTIDYYSEPDINAKGFSLITFLKMAKDDSSAQFGIYNVERKDYEMKADVTLQKRSLENCYNIVQKNDPDVNYAVYFDGETTAYIYLQSQTDDEINRDRQNKGSQAVSILKTTNKSYSTH